MDILRPEIRLLLSCVRTHIDAETATQVRTLLGQPLNWQEVLQTAHRHGVLSLLYWNLDATCPQAVPPTVLSQLKRAFTAGDFNNRFLARELSKLLQIFQAHDIPAFPYKGPTLAALVYENMALRQFSDLDIVIRKRDFSRARDLLHAQNYQPRFQLAPVQQAAYLHFFHAYDFVRSDGKISVDLHWRLTPERYPFPLDPEDVWAWLKPLSCADTTVLALPPEELLLVLCVHGTKDGWEKLRWICDIAQLLRAYPGLGWERVFAHAARCHSTQSLLLGLLIAHNLLGARLPQDIVQQARTAPRVQALAAQIPRQLFSPSNAAITFVERTLLHLKIAERFKDRTSYLAFCFYRVVTPNTLDLTMLSLPRALFFLYFFLRPIRVLKTYWLSLGRRFLRRGG